MSHFFKRALALCVCALFSTPIFGSTQITLMTYNMENLFDTAHDVGKLDWTYLPRKFKDTNPDVQRYCRAEQNRVYREECFNLDWSEAVLKIKSQNLGRMVKQVNGGRGPDILVVQEVENLNALRALNRYGLKELGYISEVLIEGPDARGIDVGILSRLPLSEAKGHIVSQKTRLVLQADFKVGEKTLSVFANHWPSQGTRDPAVRMAAAKVLRQAAEEASSQGKLVVASGDFNTLDTESPHAIRDVILAKTRGGRFLDSVTEKLNRGGKLPEGSHWYQGEWAFLDHIFVWGASVDEKRIVPDWSSVEVIRPDFALKSITWRDSQSHETLSHLVPRRFEAETGLGFSDHLPMILSFML